MTYNYFHIFRRPLLLLVILMAITTLVGCGYSIWYYKTVEKKMDNSSLKNNESWSIEFSIGRHGSGPSPSEISLNDTLSYTFAYAIEFKEKDTTKYERMRFRVDKIQYRFSSEDEPIALKPFVENYNRDEHKGATSVNHLFGYGPFLIPMPLPDTILFEQDVAIFYRDSKEEITSFHHVVKAVLIEGKYSRFEEIFIRGT